MLFSKEDYKRSQYEFRLWGIRFQPEKKLHILFVEIPIFQNLLFLWKIKEFKKHITENSKIGITIIFRYKII